MIFMLGVIGILCSTLGLLCYRSTVLNVVFQLIAGYSFAIAATKSADGSFERMLYFIGAIVVAAFVGMALRRK